jgi:hypothetical protein
MKSKGCVFAAAASMLLGVSGCSDGFTGPERVGVAEDPLNALLLPAVQKVEYRIVSPHQRTEFDIGAGKPVPGTIKAELLVRANGQARGSGRLTIGENRDQAAHYYLKIEDVLEESRARGVAFSGVVDVCSERKQECRTEPFEGEVEWHSDSGETQAFDWTFRIGDDVLATRRRKGHLVATAEPGTSIHEVCEAGPATCSNNATVSY